MSSREETATKTAAVCTNCGSMYVATVDRDGAVTPIGVSHCDCRDGDLRPVDGPR